MFKKIKRRKRYYFAGKKVSKAEKIIATFLKVNNIEFFQEYIFETCLSPLGNNLRYDFFLPSFKLLIEYNGQQHYKTNRETRKEINRFKKQIIHDNIKKQFAQNHGFYLLIIPYNYFDKLHNILTYYLLK